MLKKFSIYLIFFLFSFNANAKDYPGSFADLAEKFMPSVVKISPTQVILREQILFHLNFLQDQHLMICLENLNKEEQVRLDLVLL